MHIRDFGRYHFQGQREGEKVLQVIHRHWFNIVSHFFLIGLVSLTILGSGWILLALFPELNTPATNALVVFLQNTLFLCLWLYAYLIWIDYYFDVWIVTTERVVNIEQKGLFVRKVSELKFSRIQDVTSEVRGLIPTLLNYGDVKVQTAAEEDLFVFRQVSDPYRVRDILMEHLRNERDEEIDRVAEAVQRTTRNATTHLRSPGA